MNILNRAKAFGTTLTSKLYRKDATDTSIEAAQKVDTVAMERKVYETIRKFPNGCIQDDVLDELSSHPYSSVTARFRALLDKDLIVDTGERRVGRSGRKQRVLKAIM